LCTGYIELQHRSTDDLTCQWLHMIQIYLVNIMQQFLRSLRHWLAQKVVLHLPWCLPVCCANRVSPRCRYFLPDSWQLRVLMAAVRWGCNNSDTNVQWQCLWCCSRGRTIVRVTQFMWLTLRLKVKWNSSSCTHLRATGRHLPYGTTQCYLPPDTSECTTSNPIQKGWYSIDQPRGMEGWVDLGGWLHTEMVYLPADSHPSKY